MRETIKVRIRSVYGRPLVYPVCPQAKLLAELCGAATFTERNLNIISRLGYHVRNDNGVNVRAALDAALNEARR